MKAMNRVLLDALLPNRAWWSRVRELQDRRTRITYFAIRFGFAILAIVVICVFAIRQHPQLR